MQSVEQPPADLPKIVYAEGIQSPECPYNVSIDSQACVELLLASGVDQSRVCDTTIKVARSAPLSIIPPFQKISLLGSYDRKNNVINIFTDPHWRRTKTIRQRAETILKHREQDPNRASEVVTSKFGVEPFRVGLTDSPDKNLFPELSSGKRFSWYLNVAPPERARRTVTNLIGKKMARDLESTFAHEAKHEADLEDKKKQIGIGRLGQTTLANVAGSLLTGATIEVESILLHGQLIPNTTVGHALFLAGGFFGAITVGHQIDYWLFDPTEKNARQFEKDFRNTHMQRFITFSPK